MPTNMRDRKQWEADIRALLKGSKTKGLCESENIPNRQADGIALPVLQVV